MTNLGDVDLKFEIIEDEYSYNGETVPEVMGTNPIIEPKAESSMDEKIKPTETAGLKDVRIKIGEAQNSNKEVFWEYGHPGLANRHLLISGKSGQGKTYFMQC